MQGQPQGEGTYQYRPIDYDDIKTYSGSWLLSQPHGFGRATYNNGDVYEGQFIKGERCGTGSYWFNKIYKYTGEWKHNCFWGEGKLYKNDSVFF